MIRVMLHITVLMFLVLIMMMMFINKHETDISDWQYADRHYHGHPDKTYQEVLLLLHQISTLKSNDMEGYYVGTFSFYDEDGDSALLISLYSADNQCYARWSYPDGLTDTYIINKCSKIYSMLRVNQ